MVDVSDFLSALAHDFDTNVQDIWRHHAELRSLQKIRPSKARKWQA